MSDIPPITEDDIVNYLVHTPDFFSRHAQVLASVRLTSPHGQRALSLPERQAELLREKIKLLERRVVEMVRHSTDNALIVERLRHWAADLLREDSAAELVYRITESLQSQFLVPQVALKLWDLSPAYNAQAYAQGASADVRAFAASLAQPFCGLNSGFEAVSWLIDPQAVQSLAMLPLRVGAPAQAGSAFGLLVLASPDPQRFSEGLGTDFLEQIVELASAALSRLR